MSECVSGRVSIRYQRPTSDVSRLRCDRRFALANAAFMATFSMSVSTANEGEVAAAAAAAVATMSAGDGARFLELRRRRRHISLSLLLRSDDGDLKVYASLNSLCLSQASTIAILELFCQDVAGNLQRIPYQGLWSHHWHRGTHKQWFAKSFEPDLVFTCLLLSAPGRPLGASLFAIPFSLRSFATKQLAWPLSGTHKQ